MKFSKFIEAIQRNLHGTFPQDPEVIVYDKCPEMIEEKSRFFNFLYDKNTNIMHIHIWSASQSKLPENTSAPEINETTGEKNGKE